MKSMYSILGAFAVAAVILLQSCYPGGSATTSELNLVATKYDTTVNFQNFRTYLLPDSVIYYMPSGETADHSNDAAIFNQIRINMNAYGWSEVTNPDVTKPDVMFLVLGIKTTTYGYAGYYPGYPGGAYPGYPGWGWWGGWYPYYPYYPSGGYYAYSTGTLAMEMIDVKSSNPTDTIIDIVWNGAVNGLLTGTGVDAQFAALINQAFDQSSYLDIK